ncbi:hypothetical protein [Paraclostridium sordellii]|nr:hypothetical protein [Paeniclostridium sordellii]
MKWDNVVFEKCIRCENIKFIRSSSNLIFLCRFEFKDMMGFM